MRIFLTALFILMSMSVEAGSYFPPDFKVFAFKEGDLLVSMRGEGKFAVNKILKVDRHQMRAGESILIQGKLFTATEDDYLLIVSAAYGATQFSSMEEASAAAQSGSWRVEIDHVPNRASGAAQRQTLVGNAGVKEAELEGYKRWRLEFLAGRAGVF